MQSKISSAVSNMLVASYCTAKNINLQDSLKARIPDLQIVIVGAGIGGLAAAVGLSKAGFTNIVAHESAKEITEAGVPFFNSILHLMCPMFRLGLEYRYTFVTIGPSLFPDHMCKISPNFSRLLRRWGVLEDLRGEAVALEKNSIRSRYIFKQ
jgi:salicylate hydroxylase